MVRVALIVNVRFAVALCEAESVTLKVSGVAFAAAVGVRLTCPLPVFKVRPAGNAPEVNCQANGPTPPATPSVCEYGEPTTPLASDAVVIVNCEPMVSVKFAVAFCTGEPTSVTLMPSGVELTETVGVPLITPEEGSRVRPVGSVPEVNCQLHGPVPPAAASAGEQGTFR